MTAGKMHDRVSLEKPVGLPDGSGGTQNTWAEQFICAAQIIYLRGSEAVVAARLSGRQPAVFRIRNCEDARQIKPEWRLRDTRTGAIYNVRTVIVSDDRSMIEMTCESGVST